MAYSDFVHLHVHTQYSLLDGACQIDKLINKAASLNLPGLAITDHGNMHGAIAFYSACLKKGIKPIIGCEFYLASTSRLNKDSDSGTHHIVLLARDEEGYHNLIKLVSLANTEGFYYRPRIDHEILAQYAKGLLCTSACLKGEIAQAVLAGDLTRAAKIADTYLHIFGKGNFYLELMENNIPDQAKANAGLIRIAHDLDIPLVATNDVHYLNQEDAFAHEVLLGIGTQTTLADTKRFKFNSDQFYFKSPQQMLQDFKNTPEAVRNTLEIMHKCNLTLDFSKYYLPAFSVPPETTPPEYLRSLCMEALPRRYPALTQEIQARLDYELEIITKMGFASYFLIVWDLIKYAKDNAIPVGPGRGSAAGSIASYLLGITDIDPLRYHLLFERFLNPSRISMPDIDIDFCYEKRSRIIEYVAHKYGKDSVAQIITFGTMLARAVVRDTARVMDFSYNDADKIAKMIPIVVGKTITLQDAITTSPELSAVYKTDARVKKLIDTAMRLEGLSRHASTHAAGVVISDKPLMERIPLVRGSENEIVTGYDMESLEKTGLLKMDFLGLRTLTVIDETLKIVKQTRNHTIDFETLPLDDAKTFQLLGKGDAVGVFQLESRGMREILKKLIPERFEDLIAILALYRPGPLGSGMVDDFIERKHGRKHVVYPHPLLEPILKETYGIILYQEQTMQIVSAMAGFSIAQADLLRKAIGKKIPEIMEKQRNQFIEGCQKNSVSAELAGKIFDLIEYFSGYGFNKSHSAAYALISYRTAYLKANYPLEFMAALLTSERTNTDKVVEYVNESRHMGIPILPPDINSSFTNFTVTPENTIRFGLMAIKNIGEAALHNIIEVRSQKPFETIFEFCQRVDSQKVNKKVIESLIKSGAMDTLGLKRAQMFSLLDRLLAKTTKKKDESQFMLFEIKSDESVPDIQEWPMEQMLTYERELLGFYVSSHPLRAYGNFVTYLRRQHISTFHEEQALSGAITICGVIAKTRILLTKKNQRMAFIRIEDETSGIEAIVFPRLFEEIGATLTEKAIVILQGRLEMKDKMAKVLAERIIPMDQAATIIKDIRITIQNQHMPLAQLKTAIAENPGEAPILFILNNANFKGLTIKAAEGMRINPTHEILTHIASLVGEQNISITLRDVPAHQSTSRPNNRPYNGQTNGYQKKT